MVSNIIELAKLGHERAAELKASCGAVDVRSLAQLISDLATQLEVQFVRSTNMAVQLANAESKCRELSAENSGLKAAFDKPQAYLSWHAIPPTWEDPLPCGEYLDVHDETGHKNSDGTDCWPVFAKPEIETPATDAFLAEVRAQGVEMFAAWNDKHIKKGVEHKESLTAVSHAARGLAEQIRKGVQS
ncbi:hypothetical protein KXS46_07965 [Salmonella enterica subsp. enterica serovar Weltevreden]|nr:hypothetical protein [Salmonella enterica subsp. enterica serovar Weltevreden]MDJ6370279.1 hypothetical protein [Salmonella enterica]MDJ6428463.1 hypothetical protein [Salmonella enterica]